MFLTGALTVQIRAQLHFREAGLGFIVAGFFLTATVGVLVSGQVSDRNGPGLMMRLGTATSAICLAAIAVFAHSLLVLGILLAVAGLSDGVLQPSVNAFLTRAVVPGRQGVAFGIRQSAVPFSTLLGGLAVPALALTVGWRWAFVAGAVVAGATCVAVPSKGRMAVLESVAGAAGSPRVTDGIELERSSRQVHLPPLVVLAVAAGLGAGAANSLGAFLVSGAVAAHVSPSGAGWLAAGGSICGLIARIAVGARADRRSGGHLRVVTGMLLVGGLGYVMLATERSYLMVPGAAIAFAAGWGWNGLFNYAVVRTHPHAPAKATAITQAGVFGGAVLLPLVFGVVVDRGSYGAAWLLSAVVVVAAAAVMALGRHWLVTSADGSPGRAKIPSRASDRV